MTTWGCPECGSELLEGLIYNVVVDRTSPSLDERGRVREHDVKKQYQHMSVDQFLEQREVDQPPDLPELRCRSCDALFDQAAPVDEDD